MTEIRYHRGNINLKGVGVVHEFTDYQRIELKKCMDDPIHFIENYCKIITVDRGLELFTPFEYQKRMVRAFVEHRFIVNLLPRQMGKTTIVASFLLWYVMFHPEKTVAILANKGSTAREILSRIQRMYEYLPLWIQTGLKEWNKGSMHLENDSRIFAAASSSDSIRGFAINILYLDEFATVPQQLEFWTSTYPVISSGKTTRVIITSTPYGLDLFYKIYTDAINGNNDFFPVTVEWHERPDRDEEWKQQEIRNIGIEKFAQEYGNEFIGSSRTLISGETLKCLAEKPPILKMDSINVYAKPIEQNSYVLIADVARGKGLDYSTFSIFDITNAPYKQVCVYRNNQVSPSDFSHIIDSMSTQYNNALILVELNDLGQQVADLLLEDIGNENMLFTESRGRSGMQISSGYGKNANSGIRTTVSVKKSGCANLKMLLEQSQLLIVDKDTIDELKVFSNVGNSYQAEPGNHDDLAMNLVHFGWLSTQPYFRELTDIDTRHLFRTQSEEELEESLLPLGFKDDGIQTNDMFENYYR